MTMFTYMKNQLKSLWEKLQSYSSLGYAQTIMSEAWTWLTERAQQCASATSNSPVTRCIVGLLTLTVWTLSFLVIFSVSLVVISIIGIVKEISLIWETHMR